jgi:hypothetical protein
MKRKSTANVVPMHEQFPFKNSPQSLTFENEIKRVAVEREETIEKTIKKLAELSGISERQIYNYRNGTTDIPSGLIAVFCNQFKSNALAMAILAQCEPCNSIDEFDIVQLANESCRKTLEAHTRFLEAFSDGKIDGFEHNELKKATAGAVACFHRLDGIAEADYNRRRAV